MTSIEESDRADDQAQSSNRTLDSKQEGEREGSSLSPSYDAFRTRLKTLSHLQGHYNPKLIHDFTKSARHLTFCPISSESADDVFLTAQIPIRQTATNVSTNVSTNGLSVYICMARNAHLKTALSRYRWPLPQEEQDAIHTVITTASSDWIEAFGTLCTRFDKRIKQSDERTMNDDENEGKDERKGDSETEASRPEHPWWAITQSCGSHLFTIEGAVGIDYRGSPLKKNNQRMSDKMSMVLNVVVRENPHDSQEGRSATGKKRSREPSSEMDETVDRHSNRRARQQRDNSQDKRDNSQETILNTPPGRMPTTDSSQEAVPSVLQGPVSNRSQQTIQTAYRERMGDTAISQRVVGGLSGEAVPDSLQDLSAAGSQQVAAGHFRSTAADPQWLQNGNLPWSQERLDEFENEMAESDG